jgi:glycosyltransferase involved in cell wall biosynthesis
MKNTTLVSIGMPAFNGEQYIKNAIKSLQKQTYRNFELIISDDASIDKTQSICLSFKKKDKRIIYVRQKINIGFVNNFNYVLHKAHGKYFMWAGCDDIWDKTYIEKLITLLHKYPDSVISISKFNNIYKNKPYNYLKKQYIKNGLKRINYLLHFIKTRNLSYFYGLHKTRVLKKIGGYHRDSRPFFHSSDYLTIFKVLCEGPLAYHDEVLFYKRDTGHYTKKFDLMKHRVFNSIICYKVARFMFSPIYYFYDLLFSIKYTIQSNISSFNKLCIIYFSFIGFLKYNGMFMYESAKGIKYLCFGFLNKK